MNEDEFSKFPKGTFVIVRATVHTKDRPFMQNSESVTVLRNVEVPMKEPWRHEIIPRNFIKIACEPWLGMVVGLSKRISGQYYPGTQGNYDFEGNPGEIRDCQYHRVLMVIRADHQSWVRPYACIPEDLEIRKETP
jgi:hypothetical protein